MFWDWILRKIRGCFSGPEPEPAFDLVSPPVPIARKVRQKRHAPVGYTNAVPLDLQQNLSNITTPQTPDHPFGPTANVEAARDTADGAGPAKEEAGNAAEEVEQDFGEGVAAEEPEQSTETVRVSMTNLA